MSILKLERTSASHKPMFSLWCRMCCYTLFICLFMELLNIQAPHENSRETSQHSPKYIPSMFFRPPRDIPDMSTKLRYIVQAQFSSLGRLWAHELILRLATHPSISSSRLKSCSYTLRGAMLRMFGTIQRLLRGPENGVKHKNNK